MDSVAMNEGKFNCVCSVLLSRCIYLVGLFWTIILLFFTILTSHPPLEPNLLGSASGEKPSTLAQQGTRMVYWYLSGHRHICLLLSADQVQRYFKQSMAILCLLSPQTHWNLSNHILTLMRCMLLCYVILTSVLSLHSYIYVNLCIYMYPWMEVVKFCCDQLIDQIRPLKPPVELK